MKIAQINPGHMTIPPDSWGAVEKIIWYYKLESEKKGHEVHIRYINEVQRGEFDVVHVHMWNHAFEMYEKGIPYVFTCHDHHAYALGKASQVYKNNILAMKRSELSIVPATYLVDYFENVPVYLRHGINPEEFYVGQTNESPKLLIVGNNGMSGDSTFDRKGFRYAIEAAEKLNMPITVVGPTDCNKQFFDYHNDLLKPNVEIKYDLNDKQLQEVYRSHDILIHASSVEAGHPPLTLLEAAASGLPIITTDCAGDLFTTRTGRNSDEVVKCVREVIRLYALNRAKTIRSVEQFYWTNVVDDLIQLYEETTMEKTMRTSALSVYKKAEKRIKKNNVMVHFIDGAFIEITGQYNEDYNVKFIDNSNGEVVYQLNMKNNQWARCSREWVTDWKIIVTSSNGEVQEHRFDPTNKRVLISIESSSLGDTLAWFPYAEEFRKKHNCKVVVSTFLNDLFEKEYPNLEFIKPGTTVHNLYALYRIGIFYNENGFDPLKHKTDYRKLRLQEIATDILGLEYKEVRPKLHIENRKRQIDGDYVTIGIHSTAQSKYWNNKTGWQDTVDYLNSKGIKTVHISKQVGEFMGNKPPVNIVDKTGDLSLQNRMTDILNSKMFIGISSGLSWVAWALGVPTVLISGCTEEVHEPLDNVFRVINTNVCNSCFSNHYFDKGDWNWCPLLKGTERQFECSKEIPFSMVRPKIDKILSI
jgi:autotransporter strand-loop-strand O-heptosyltransferase